MPPVVAASVWPLCELEPLLPAHRPHAFSQISELSLLMDGCLFVFLKATFTAQKQTLNSILFIYLFHNISFLTFSCIHVIIILSKIPNKC